MSGTVMMGTPRGPGTVRRTAPAVALALIMALAVSGCVTRGDTGPRPEVATHGSTDAAVALKDVPGVVEAFVASGPVGLPGQIQLTVGLDLEAGYAGDLPALLDYTLALAWSVTDDEPTTSVSVGFLGGETAVDLGPVAAELGVPPADSPKLRVSIDSMAERYGPWPGPVPEVPASLDAVDTDPASAPPATAPPVSP